MCIPSGYTIMISVKSTDANSTQAKLSKIPSVPGLYRHDDGHYYGKIKRDGKISKKALTTENGVRISDRKIAEKALREWVDNFGKPAKVAPPTLGELFTRFVEMKKGKANSTLKKYDWVLSKFEKGGADFLKTPVDLIKPSELSTFLSKYEKEMKPTTYNELTLTIKQVFDVALMDSIIPANPYSLLPNKRLKNHRKPADVPTIEQCEAIVESIRTQEYADTREESADKCEFLHLAALGEAEANYLTWKNVDFENERINAKRIKTGVHFSVPIYPHLKPFLIKLYENQGRPTPETPIFKIKTIKQSLYNACKRLKMTAYSPIDFRKARIVWMIRKGVTVETLAKWQGHNDNGVLIRNTYSWVLDGGQAQFEQEQLAKLAVIHID